jgi:hypothetical protein
MPTSHPLLLGCSVCSRPGPNLYMVVEMSWQSAARVVDLDAIDEENKRQQRRANAKANAQLQSLDTNQEDGKDTKSPPASPSSLREK